MKVLVACEYSGTVRDAFIARGHDAWSCDILPSDVPGPHFQGDAIEVINRGGWDLLIGHPPCTFLSYAGTRYWNQPGRARKRLEALDFFLQMWEAPIEKICLENPLGCIDPVVTKHHQVVEPYYFGESAKKRTCLWLKNLPMLTYQLPGGLFEATGVDRPEPVYIDARGKARHFTDAISGRRKDAQKLRSKTFISIAKAMAEQWG